MTSCLTGPYEDVKKRLERRILQLFCVASSSSDQLPEITIIDEPRRSVTAENVQDFIYSREFHNASKILIVLEREAYGSKSNNTNIEEVTKKQEKVALLFNELGREVSGIIGKSLETLFSQNGNESRIISEITEAVKAVAEQVYEDDKYYTTKAELKPRPRKWKQKWVRVVKQSVDRRMKGQAETPSGQNSSTFAKQLEHMGKTMTSDLILVVNHLKPLYPDIFEVCDVYAKNYHDYFSAQLNAATDLELGESDALLLLVWLQSIYPNDIENHPDLVHSVNWEKLGPLLPYEKVSELEHRYISNVEEIVEARMNTSLDIEVQFWNEEKEPAILNEVSHSELPIDTIQALNVEIEGAEKVSLQLVNRLLPLLIEKLAAFLKRYKWKFEEFVEENRNHAYFLPIVIANVNSSGDYRDYIRSLEHRPLEDEVKWNVWDILSEIERIGFEALLQDLYLELEPYLKKLSEKNGLCSNGNVLQIVKISDEHIPKFRTLKSGYYQEIVETIHLYLVKEYITRIMKKKVSFKGPEQQKILAKQMFENAAQIKECCMTHGSQARYLNDAIPKLAEIVNLQDIDAIKLVVASLAHQYPDISKNQVGAVLYIKGNLKSSDLKSILNILYIGEIQDDDTPKLFSYIKVS